MPPRLSPPFVQGTLTTKADVYAIGVLMWEIYTAEKVWGRGGQVGVLHHHRGGAWGPHVGDLDLHCREGGDAKAAEWWCRGPPSAPLPLPPIQPSSFFPSQVFKQLSDSEVILAVVTKKARPAFPPDVPSRCAVLHAWGSCRGGGEDPPRRSSRSRGRRDQPDPMNPKPCPAPSGTSSWLSAAGPRWWS